jgi:hypothetical protein
MPMPALKGKDLAVGLAPALGEEDVAGAVIDQARAEIVEGVDGRPSDATWGAR